MPRYDVTVVRHEGWSIEVEADSREEAEEIAVEDYQQGKLYYGETWVADITEELGPVTRFDWAGQGRERAQQ